MLEQVTSDYQMQRVLLKALAQKLSLISLNPEKINPDNRTKYVLMTNLFTCQLKTQIPGQDIRISKLSLKSNFLTSL